MTTSLCFTPAAEIDLAAVFVWYEEQREGLGGRFIDAADELFRRILGSPRLFPEVVAGYRRFMTNWPEWWNWELELSPHLLKRMVDRGFSQTDLRAMMESATGFHEDAEPGRWIVESKHEQRSWQVIVEPDSIDKLLVVVTAFPVEES